VLLGLELTLAIPSGFRCSRIHHNCGYTLCLLHSLFVDKDMKNIRCNTLDLLSLCMQGKKVSKEQKSITANKQKLQAIKSGNKRWKFVSIVKSEVNV